MTNIDREYLERRHRECLAHAENATDPNIAEVHRQFAAEYERKLAVPYLIPARHDGADLAFDRVSAPRRHAP